MPKTFVQVCDPERPRVEQLDDPAFQRHRQFDLLSQPYNQFQGAQERTPRDDSAQIPRLTPSGHMVRNEKGLWVKAPKQQESRRARPTEDKAEEESASCAHEESGRQAKRAKVSGKDDRDNEGLDHKKGEDSKAASKADAKADREKAALERLAAMRAKQLRR
eukprot:TRINITY_DN16592_c0_g1_i1.p1 TRINITY_DN16592_c0_g1~~TRINITY_DN16592_c0_g1_i1.p1  ORF type:complete len:169 (-),score=25.32 TRINITY_DN16592_c0_g1_i1:146-631(-)